MERIVAAWGMAGPAIVVPATEPVVAGALVAHTIVAHTIGLVVAEVLVAH
jgi:hypothetical protein